MSPLMSCWQNCSIPHDPPPVLRTANWLYTVPRQPGGGNEPYAVALASQIHPSDPFAGFHVSGRTAIADLSHLQQVGIVRHAQGLAGVLLCHENADATGANLPRQIEQVLHH